MSSSPPLKIETLPSAWIGCKITTFIWNMQIKFYNLLKSGLFYTFFVNLYPSREKKRSKICVFPNFIVILQRETKDSNHSSVSLCIFCRLGGGKEGGKEDREGGGAEPGGKGGEEAEQGFAILLPHGQMGR